MLTAHFHRRADLELDDLLHKVEYETFGAVEKQRSDTRYRSVFPKGLTALVAMRGAEESWQLKQLLENIRRHFPAIAEKYGADLERLSSACLGAEEAYRQAEVTYGAAFSAERLAAYRAHPVALQERGGAFRRVPRPAPPGAVVFPPHPPPRRG